MVVRRLIKAIAGILIGSAAMVMQHITLFRDSNLLDGLLYICTVAGMSIGFAFLSGVFYAAIDDTPPWASKGLRPALMTLAAGVFSMIAAVIMLVGVAMILGGIMT